MAFIRLVSDLHLTLESNLDKVVGDIVKSPENGQWVIIAGDICRLENMDQITLPFLVKLAANPCVDRIVYVCGNHEFYNNASYSVSGLTALLKAAVRGISEKVIVLDNESIDVPNTSIRIFGGTGWSFLPFDHVPQIALPIYNHNGARITASWYNSKYFTFLDQLETAILTAQSDCKELYVVSHHSPTFNRTLKPEHYPTPQRFLYCSDSDRYLKKSYVHTWMFGHTHVNVDYIAPGGTRIWSNQYVCNNFS